MIVEKMSFLGQLFDSGMKVQSNLSIFAELR